MRRLSLWAACSSLALMVAALASTAFAGTSISVNFRVGDPYRGPEIVFAHDPEIVVVPDTRVYYVRNCDYDLYRYGSYWYYSYDGGWYRARSHHGPFAYISYRSVPRAVSVVPVKYRRHWHEFPGQGYARGHEKQERREAVREIAREDRRENHRRGH
jgi:hypothetical protein